MRQFCEISAIVVALLQGEQVGQRGGEGWVAKRSGSFHMWNSKSHMWEEARVIDGGTRFFFLLEEGGKLLSCFYLSVIFAKLTAKTTIKLFLRTC